jgi:hypothetical protein
VAGIDQVQARRVCPSMEKEAFDTWILFEAFNTVRLINRRVSDPEPLKCPS